jgi:hypothetical protein
LEHWGLLVLESAELFAFIVAFFLVGLAAFAAAVYWFSRSSRRGFDSTRGRLNEVSFYLNEFSKSATKIREKAASKATPVLVEKKLEVAAKDLEEEREFQKEKQKWVQVNREEKKRVEKNGGE